MSDSDWLLLVLLWATGHWVPNLFDMTPTLIGSVRVPTEHFIIFPTAQQHFCVLVTPRDGQNTLLMAFQHLDGGGGKSKVPKLNERTLIFFRRQAQLGGNIRVPCHSRPPQAARGVRKLDDGFIVFPQVPHNATRRKCCGQNVLNLWIKN